MRRFIGTAQCLSRRSGASLAIQSVSTGSACPRASPISRSIFRTLSSSSPSLSDQSSSSLSPAAPSDEHISATAAPAPHHQPAFLPPTSQHDAVLGWFDNLPDSSSPSSSSSSRMASRYPPESYSPIDLKPTTPYLPWLPDFVPSQALRAERDHWMIRRDPEYRTKYNRHEELPRVPAPSPRKRSFTGEEGAEATTAAKEEAADAVVVDGKTTERALSTRMLRAVGLKKDWDSLHSWWSAYVGLEEEKRDKRTMHGSKKTLHRAELRRNEEDIAERVKLNPEDATKFFPEPNTRSSPLIAYDFLIHNALAADRLLFYPPRDPRDAPPLDWYHHVFGTALLQEVGLAGWDAAVAYYMGLEAELNKLEMQLEVASTVTLEDLRASFRKEYERFITTKALSDPESSEQDKLGLADEEIARINALDTAGLKKARKQLAKQRERWEKASQKKNLGAVAIKPLRGIDWIRFHGARLGQEFSSRSKKAYSVEWKNFPRDSPQELFWAEQTQSFRAFVEKTTDVLWEKMSLRKREDLWQQWDEEAERLDPEAKKKRVAFCLDLDARMAAQVIKPTEPTGKTKTNEAVEAAQTKKQ